MTYRYATSYKWVNILADFLLLNIALTLGFALKRPGLEFDEAILTYRLDFLLLNLLWFYASSVNKLNQNIFKRDAVPLIRATLYSLALYFFLGVLLKLSLPQFDLSKTFIAYSYIIFSVLIVSSKILFLIARRPHRMSLIRYKRIVIVGAGPVGLDLYNYLHANQNLGYKVDGFFDDDQTRITQDILLLGDVNDCIKYSVENNIEAIFCALPDAAASKIKALMREADKKLIRFRLVPDMKDYFKKSFKVEMFGYLPVLTPRKEPLEDRMNQLIKRLFDILFSLFVVLFFLSWLVPIIALAIRLESKGPVFFRQLRSGKDNKPFNCLKFRSMKVNQLSDSQQATKGDTRITRVGAFIRKTSIDELPQFFNVLKGEMSVVGPRPHMLKHTQDYSKLIDTFMVRHFVLPGITGWAQVRGFRGETRNIESMDKRVEADIWYLENWSLLLDLKIIFLTVWQAILGDENAF